MINDRYILYLEDDSIELMKFKLTFKKQNANIDIKSFENGEDGLNFLLNNINTPPSIIILDLNMPLMNGFEFLELIKDNLTLKKIPVIVFSSSDNKNDILFSYDHQVAGYFVKPFSTEEYEKVIGTIHQYWQSSKIPK